MAADDHGLRFPAELRRARQAADLSYRALAARCGLSHSFLSHLEKGERRAPRMDRVAAIAEALGAVTPSFMVAALADRTGEDVTRLIAALLRSASVGREVDVTGGGVQVEAGPPGGEEALRELAVADGAEQALRRRLYFVDLQFDAEILRVAFGDPESGDPTVLSLVGAESRENEP